MLESRKLGDTTPISYCLMTSRKKRLECWKFWARQSRKVKRSLSFIVLIRMLASSDSSGFYSSLRVSSTTRLYRRQETLRQFGSLTSTRIRFLPFHDFFFKLSQDPDSLSNPHDSIYDVLLDSFPYPSINHSNRFSLPNNLFLQTPRSPRNRRR